MTSWCGDQAVLKKEAPVLIHGRIAKIPGDVDSAIDGEEFAGYFCLAPAGLPMTELQTGSIRPFAVLPERVFANGTGG